MPKVSVTVPCFNSAPFIRDTLGSVLSQTYGDYEIIVVDDGSTDGTGDIIRSLKDPRIKYVYKENEGLSATRNKAIELARGEYIAILDHDDLWMPEKLERQVGMLDNNRDLGVVFSDSYILKDGINQEMTYFERFRPKKGFILEDLLFSTLNFIVMSSAVIPRHIFEKVGLFRTDLRLGEDIELFLRIAEYYRYDYIDEPLVTYRLHENNFSRQKEVFFGEALKILELWQRKRPDLFLNKKERFLKKEAALLADLAHHHASNFKRNMAIRDFDMSLNKHRSLRTLVKKYILMLFGCYIYGKLSRMRNA